MKPYSLGSLRLFFSLRGLACALLLLLPLCYPHSPWKPTETRIVGIVLEHLNNPSLAMPSTHRMFWGATIKISQWMPRDGWPLEVIARAVSLWLLILGAMALLGWADAMHRRYPLVIPEEIGSGAPLLVASSLGIMFQGYQATPESAWFTGIAGMLWGGAETHRFRRVFITGVSVLWLWACGGLLGVFLAIICGGVIPWLSRWYAGERSYADRVEGAVFLAGAVLVFALNDRDWTKALTWQVNATYFKEVLRLLMWYALPIWPLALAVWWRGRGLPERIYKEWRVWRWEPLAQLAAALLIGTQLGGMSGDSRGLMYLPFLVSMALPALYLVDVRSWFNAVHWFTRSVLILLLIAVWGAVFALYSHIPQTLFLYLEAYQPGFNSSVIEWSAWALSAVLTCYAVRYLLVPCKTLRDSLWRWTLGFGCTACVIRLMLVPYIDYGRSYRMAMQALNASVPPQVECVEMARSVGLSQRAMWQYYTGRSVKKKGCDWRVIQARPGKESTERIEQEKANGWQFVAQTHRPGDRSEAFLLLRTNKLP